MKAVSQGTMVKEGAGLPESKQDHCFQFVFFLAHTEMFTQPCAYHFYRPLVALK